MRIRELEPVERNFRLTGFDEDGCPRPFRRDEQLEPGLYSSEHTAVAVHRFRPDNRADAEVFDKTPVALMPVWSEWGVKTWQDHNELALRHHPTERQRHTINAFRQNATLPYYDPASAVE